MKTGCKRLSGIRRREKEEVSSKWKLRTYTWKWA